MDGELIDWHLATVTLADEVTNAKINAAVVSVWASGKVSCCRTSGQAIQIN